MKTALIVGNWKMNKTIQASRDLVRHIHYGIISPNHIDIVVAPPFTSLFAVVEALKNSFINIAAQNIFWEEEGAYTGEVSASQAKEAGAAYVIIGHSERRQYFHETNETINKKIKAALKHELIPIVCIGETVEQREANEVDDVIETQLNEGFAGLSPNEMRKVVIAYEPVWAIGTGKTASPEQAEEVHHLIRQIVSQEFGSDAAGRLKILYGGSVKPANSQALFSQPNINGALIGGASLNADDFIEIIRHCPADR